MAKKSKKVEGSQDNSQVEKSQHAANNDLQATPPVEQEVVANSQHAANSEPEGPSTGEIPPGTPEPAGSPSEGTPPKEPQDPTLQGFADGANAAHRNYEGVMRSALRKAVPYAKEAGDYLSKAKAELRRLRQEESEERERKKGRNFATYFEKKVKEPSKYPSWKKWLEDNVAFSQRTAEVYIQIAEEMNWKVIEPLLGDKDLSIRRVLRILDEDKVVIPHEEGDPWTDDLNKKVEVYKGWVEQVTKPTAETDPSLLEISKMALKQQAAKTFARWPDWLVIYLGSDRFGAESDLGWWLNRLKDEVGPVARPAVTASTRLEKAIKELDENDPERAQKEHALKVKYCADLVDGVDLDGLTESQRRSLQFILENAEAEVQPVSSDPAPTPNQEPAQVEVGFGEEE